ncbi:triose-phosphate transporter family-domain-containing protein [Zopfochytrium polystomum]|nr:triose-phosphate transporter family-domain-containing protein [Zopfochytrium polystomum]
MSPGEVVVVPPARAGDGGDRPDRHDHRTSSASSGSSNNTSALQAQSLSSLACNVALFVLLWYGFSAALSILNKAIVGHEHGNFNMPLLLSCVHSVVHTIVSAAVIHWQVPRGHRSRQAIPLKKYLVTYGPTALCTALDIGLSNSSLHYISLSFYTMIKSSVPVWVLIFAFAFGLEQVRLPLVLIILVICFGVVFTIVGELRFSWIGFNMVLIASMCSGLRWSLTQILLSHPSSDTSGASEPMHPIASGRPSPSSPLSTLYRLSPIMAALLGLGSALTERAAAAPGDDHGGFWDSPQAAGRTVGVLVAGGVLALCMTLAEFHLIANTNVVTLSVAGIFKEVFMIAVSMVVFGDRLTGATVVGVVISIAGIVAYTFYKLQRLNAVPRTAYKRLNQEFD